MGVTMIRVLVLAAAAAFVLAPTIASANCGANHTAQLSQASTTDMAAKSKTAPASTVGTGDAIKTAPKK
jgi:hypothetical protein